MMRKHPGSIRMLGLAAAGMIALAGCSTTSPNYGSSYPSSYPSSSYPSRTTCADCGIVTRIDVIPSGRSAPSATGAILGGIVGAVAGHEISDHTGGSKGNQNVAAVAGAAAGAMAGNAIQNNAQYGVYLYERADRNTVEGNSITGSGGAGVYVRTGGSAILRNEIRGNGVGVAISGGPLTPFPPGGPKPVPALEQPGRNNVISGNTIADSDTTGRQAAGGSISSLSIAGYTAHACKYVTSRGAGT